MRGKGPNITAIRLSELATLLTNRWITLNNITILLGISLVWPKAADFDSVITGSNPVSSAIFLKESYEAKINRQGT